MTESSSRTLRLAAQAWTFGVLFFLYDFNTLLSTSGERRMIAPVPLTSLVLAQVAQIFLIALLYMGIVLLLRRFTPWRITQWLVAVFTALALAVRLRPFVTGLPHSRYHLRFVAVLPLAIVVYLAATRFPGLTLRVKKIGGNVLAGFVIFAILVTGELLRIAFWHPAPVSFSTQAPATEDPNRPRLVWVVFDELDFYQTFGHRDSTVQLPALDRLRSQSDLFADVPLLEPRTFQAIPSFLSGQPVDKVRYTWDHRLLVRQQATRSWIPFPVQDTVFYAAHQAGLRSAIVGWAIPYCHLFHSVVDQCYWTNHDASWDGAALAAEDSFLHDFFAPLRNLVVSAYSPSKAKVPYLQEIVDGHDRSINDLAAHALDALANSHADVIYLHIPAPHPPGTRSRRTGQLGLDNGYLDSLAVADGILGHMLDVLQSQPRWKNTTLIVQGDHGWRDWGGTLYITPADRTLWVASPKNAHPLVLVHHAGQNTASTISQQVSLLGTREVALSVVRQMKK